MRAALLAALLVAASLAPSRAVARRPAKGQTAESLAQQAAVVAKQGDLPLAAKMFHSAYALNKSGWAYLYSAARAEQLAGDVDAARRDYQRYLQGAPADHPLRARARKYSAEVERAHADAMHRERNKQRKLAAIARSKKEARSRRGLLRVAGWVAVGLGGVAMGGGGWMYSVARGDKADLEAKTKTTGGEPIRAISYTEARAQADAVSSDLRLGVTTMSAGLAVLAVGGWLVWTNPAEDDDAGGKVTAGVGAGGGPSMHITWRF